MNIPTCTCGAETLRDSDPIQCEGGHFYVPSSGPYGSWVGGDTFKLGSLGDER